MFVDADNPSYLQSPQSAIAIPKLPHIKKVRVMVTTTQPLTLEEFLKLPETKPASEYINGQIIQKPMPKGRHSRLQGKLCTVINQLEDKKIAYAFPELRCTLSVIFGFSIVIFI